MKQMDLLGLNAPSLARAADIDIESYVQLPSKFSARQLVALGTFAHSRLTAFMGRRIGELQLVLLLHRIYQPTGCSNRILGASAAFVTYSPRVYLSFSWVG